MNELDEICICGHKKREHADDISAGEIIKEASEECMDKSGGYWCECKKFKKKHEDTP